ncbi:protein YgfX [Aliidiomarina sp. Khilg15.8]
MADSCLRVRIRPSRRRLQVSWILIATLVAVCLLLGGTHHGWLLPFALTLLSGLLFSLSYRQLDDTLTLSETGAGRWGCDQRACYILPDSLLTPYLLALHLAPEQPVLNRLPGQWYLMFPDQLNARNWRRIRRVVLNVRH